MTSLAFTAHSVSALSSSFNANFYIAAATVIPFQFLAIAVQGRSSRFGITQASVAEVKA